MTSNCYGVMEIEVTQCDICNKAPLATIQVKIVHAHAHGVDVGDSVSQAEAHALGVDIEGDEFTLYSICQKCVVKNLRDVEKQLKRQGYL